jgi:molecular chaperone DnaK (HSP70)
MKVPSVIGIDADQRVRFGYAVSFEDERFQLFKLLMVKQNFLPQTLRASAPFSAIQEKSATLGKTARELVSMYLRLLWKSFTEALARKEEEWTGLQLVITIPAGWPDSVQEVIIDALGDAGILAFSPGCQVRFLREPQAAAQAMVPDFYRDGSVKPEVRWQSFPLLCARYSSVAVAVRDQAVPANSRNLPC